MPIENYAGIIQFELSRTHKNTSVKIANGAIVINKKLGIKISEGMYYMVFLKGADYFECKVYKLKDLLQLIRTYLNGSEDYNLQKYEAINVN